MQPHPLDLGIRQVDILLIPQVQQTRLGETDPGSGQNHAVGAVSLLENAAIAQHLPPARLGDLFQGDVNIFFLINPSTNLLENIITYLVI